MICAKKKIHIPEGKGFSVDRFDDKIAGQRALWIVLMIKTYII